MSIVDIDSSNDYADRCEAVHAEDHSLCEGHLSAVRIVDQYGDMTTACEQHGAVLLASLTNARVYPVAVQGAAIRVWRRAQLLPPFVFLADPFVQRAQTLEAAEDYPAPMGGAK